MHIVQWGGGGEDEDEDEEEREPCDAAAKSPAGQDGSCCKCVSGKTTIMMISINNYIEDGGDEYDCDHTRS